MPYPQTDALETRTVSDCVSKWIAYVTLRCWTVAYGVTDIGRPVFSACEYRHRRRTAGKGAARFLRMVFVVKARHSLAAGTALFLRQP